MKKKRVKCTYTLIMTLLFNVQRKVPYEDREKYSKQTIPELTRILTKDINMLPEYLP